MRFWTLVLTGAVMLSACQKEERSLAEQAASDEKAIAEVEAAQTPPPDVVSPQRITPDEQARSQLSESGCRFAVNNPELGAQAILQRNVGYMKFENRVERFAPDAGSGDGPAGTSGRYDGATHGLVVEYDLANAAPADGGRTSVPTHITLKDGRKRTVYVAEGTALCAG